MDTGLLILSSVQIHDAPARCTLAAQILRFLGAGGLATLLHWGVMGALILLGASALAATVAGSVAGALGNYGLQSRWVFAARASAHAMRRYVCTLPLGWGVNAVVFAVLAAHATVWLAQIGAHAVVAAVNFMLYRSLVFHERAASERS